MTINLLRFKTVMAMLVLLNCRVWKYYIVIDEITKTVLYILKVEYWFISISFVLHDVMTTPAVRRILVTLTSVRLVFIRIFLINCLYRWIIITIIRFSSDRIRSLLVRFKRYWNSLYIPTRSFPYNAWWCIVWHLTGWFLTLFCSVTIFLRNYNFFLVTRTCEIVLKFVCV